MAAYLSECDLKQISTVQRVLLAVLEYPSSEAWAEAVVDALRPLFRQESAALALKGSGDRPFYYAEGFDPAPLQASYEVEHPTDPATRMILQERLTTVTSHSLRDRGGDAFWRSYTRSPAVNELYRPAGFLALAALLIHHPSKPSDGTIGLAGNLTLGAPRWNHRVASEQAHALLGLLWPAFDAAAHALWRMDGVRLPFTAIIDDLDTPALLCSPDGHVLHRNPAFARVFEGVPSSRAAVTGPIHELVRRVTHLARPAASRSRDTWKTIGESGTARVGSYRLRAVYVGPAVSGHRDAVLVTIESGEEAPPPVDVLRARFGLTTQQAHVALLLAERRTTPEIAEALFISPHTARRHTEAVLEKLGLHDRRHVRERLADHEAGAPPAERTPRRSG